MLKRVLIFFVALLGIENTNSQSTLVVPQAHPILYAYYQGDELVWYKTTTETDKIEVEMLITCGNSDSISTKNFCDVISYEGDDKDKIKEREFVKLFGIYECPIVQGNYTMVRGSIDDPNVIAILTEGCEDKFDGLMNLYVNKVWGVQYAYTL